MHADYIGMNASHSHSSIHRGTKLINVDARRNPPTHTHRRRWADSHFALNIMTDNAEQAYWTLVSILSRILPAGYYTPDLLSSRADQLVLAELVGLYVPKVHSHLESLGVDLSSITFGWFLSLFTDCLPVEVSRFSPQQFHSITPRSYSVIVLSMDERRG